jgi:hypothetical protein
MKLVFGLLFACLVGTSYGQNGVLLEGLLQAQSELALTHEFFETLMSINRGQLSAYIYRASRFVINSHMDSYAFIMTNGIEARERIEALVPENPGQQACVDRALARFELQKQRFGQQLGM